MPSAGTLLCLASAAAFGAMGIFGKLAYEEGATVGTLLATRFVLAAALLWVFVVASGGAHRMRELPRRDVGIAFALGAVVYSAQAGGYFAALRRIDASLLSLLVYTYPAIVTVAAIALRREPANARTGAALALASAGLVLVLAGAGAGALDPLGAALGLGAAVVYSAYILASEGVVARVGPLALSTLVCSGAAATLTLSAAAFGDLDPGSVSAAGLGWLAGIAVVSTVGAVALFFAGLGRVGPTAASILSTLEPVVTVVLAFLVFGETLGPAQLAGGALVLIAVLAVRAPARTRDTAQAVSQENLDVVRDQFAATNERDFPRAMSHYAEDVELVVDPGAFLERGTFTGRHEVGQWFANWFKTFEPGYQFEIEEARDLGDVVFLLASHRGRGRTSGLEVHGQTGYLYRLRGGKIVRAELYASGAQALEAAGLRE